jgi:mono/diheme cytochrome c family protein
MKHVVFSLSLLLSAAMFAACSSEKPAAPAETVPEKPVDASPPPPAPPAAGTATATANAAAAPAAAAAADPKAEAEQIFATRCVTCHGATGKGDGAAAAALNPKPRDYSDAKWQAETTDELIAKAIREGGAAVGKSPLMPPNPDLVAKPDVVAALVAKVRSFKAP